MATAELVAASGSGGADSSSTGAFMETYGKLKKELLEDHASEFTDESSLQWIDRVRNALILLPLILPWVLA
jgi:hypothetical protein